MGETKNQVIENREVNFSAGRSGDGNKKDSKNEE